MIIKATDALLKDHRMIRKLLDSWQVDNPRFDALTLTLQRTVLSHAWFEDQIFLPAIAAEPLIFQCFQLQIAQEHHDIESLLKTLRRMDSSQKKEQTYCALQLRVLLETHFTKEEEALFPLAEKLLTEEGLITLGAEMHQRADEVRKFIEA
jgi:iron-sulfur cluster repair protein YtfE (RIC family)